MIELVIYSYLVLHRDLQIKGGSHGAASFMEEKKRQLSIVFFVIEWYDENGDSNHGCLLIQIGRGDSHSNRLLRHTKEEGNNHFCFLHHTSMKMKGISNSVMVVSLFKSREQLYIVGKILIFSKNMSLKSDVQRVKILRFVLHTIFSYI